MGESGLIVFQHDAPLRSYVWHNIILQFAQYGRCIALDFMAMSGPDEIDDSGSGRYTSMAYRSYMDVAFAALGVGAEIVSVWHGRGTALTFGRAT